MPKTVVQESESQAFHCPHCNAYAHHKFENVTTRLTVHPGRAVRKILTFENDEVLLSICTYCERHAIWVSDNMVFPRTAEYPIANQDMPDSVKEVYDEAGAIMALSPRAACALLRLALQMLLEQLGESGNINRAIDSLVSKGLDPGTKQAMHILRVIGNHAIHPGKISFDGDTDTGELFRLLNAIVLERITLPKTRAELFDNLPEKDRKYIEERE